MSKNQHTAGYLVLLSGGLDSTALLAHHLHQGHQATALTVNYGQRHIRELAAARDIAAHYGIPHHILDMSSWGRLLAGSSLTDTSIPVPRADYDEASMATTVVPNRNATFLMAAAGIAQTIGANLVSTAVHSGDHHLYPDCRPEFITAAHDAAMAGTGGAVGITAPFVNLTKTQVVALGANLDAPLDLTWSCYEGRDLHCGQCGTCRERQDAFTSSNTPDPTHYQP